MVAIFVIVCATASIGWEALFGPEAQQRRAELRNERDAARKRRRERVEEP